LSHVVQETLFGSIMSNLLLVLGMSFCIRGYKTNKSIYTSFSFHNNFGTQNIILLFFFIFGNALIQFYVWNKKNNFPSFRKNDLWISSSIFFCIVCFVMYIIWIIFRIQISLHKNKEEENDEDNENNNENEIHFHKIATGLILFIVSISTSILSDYLVASIDDFSKHWNVHSSFLTIIVIPIVGNACEHTTALIMAYKNKVNVSISISFASANQIAFIVLSTIAFVSFFVKDEQFMIDVLFLKLHHFFVLLLTILFLYLILQKGQSSFLEGMLILLIYIIYASSLFFQ